jgi:hypothetical protein
MITILRIPHRVQLVHFPVISTLLTTLKLPLPSHYLEPDIRIIIHMNTSLYALQKYQYKTIQVTDVSKNENALIS